MPSTHAPAGGLVEPQVPWPTPPLKTGKPLTTLSVSGSEDFLADHRCGDSWRGTAASAMKGTCRRWTSARSCDGRTPIAGASADGRATARVRLPTHKARLGWGSTAPSARGVGGSRVDRRWPACWRSGAGAQYRQPSCAQRQRDPALGGRSSRQDGPMAHLPIGPDLGSAGRNLGGGRERPEARLARSSGRLISHPIASQEPRDQEPRPAPAPQHPPDTRLG